MSYWDKLSKEERSAEMSRRRKMYKGDKPLGGLHYVDEAERKRIMEIARKAKEAPPNEKAESQPVKEES